MGGRHESHKRGDGNVMRGKLTKGAPGKNGPIHNEARKAHGHVKMHDIKHRFDGLCHIKTEKRRKR